MIFPYPLLAIKQLQSHIKDIHSGLDDMMNLIIDAYCFKASSPAQLKYLMNKLNRKVLRVTESLVEMNRLLDDCWWEQLVRAFQLIVSSFF